MRKGLLSLAFLILLLIPVLSILSSAQTYPNTWVIAFYPGSYPSGVSPSNYTFITVNFTIPNYLQTNGCYLGFVLTTFVKASAYIGILPLGTCYLGLQIALVFVSSACTYVLVEQVWTTSGIKIYCKAELITLRPNTEGYMSMDYMYKCGHVAVGILESCGAVYNLYFPTSYRYGYVTYDVINTCGFTDPSGVNPSFAIEGTYTGQPPFEDTGWDGMWINGPQVQSINAVAGHSDETDVGGTAHIPSYYAESGLTLFHNEFLGIWWSPYAWYFSIGTPQAYNGLHYRQLSENQSYNTINGLNYALHWIPP